MWSDKPTVEDSVEMSSLEYIDETLRSEPDMLSLSSSGKEDNYSLTQIPSPEIPDSQSFLNDDDNIQVHQNGHEPPVTESSTSVLLPGFNTGSRQGTHAHKDHDTPQSFPEKYNKEMAADFDSFEEDKSDEFQYFMNTPQNI